MYRTEQEYIQAFGRNPKGQRLLECLRVNGSTLLTCIKGKGKALPITGHEGPEGEQMYSSTLPSTSALDGVWVVNATPGPLYLSVKDPVLIV